LWTKINEKPQSAKHEIKAAQTRFNKAFGFLKNIKTAWEINRIKVKKWINGKRLIG
jgi:hypothetical protein